MREVKAIALISGLILCALLLIPNTAQAATTEVQIGSARGKLVFEPSTVTIRSGDTIKWVNNLPADSACNVVFDRMALENSAIDETPPGTDQEMFDYMSYKSLITDPKQTVSKILNVPPGKYTYTCTPYQSEGMVGQVIVEQS